MKSLKKEIIYPIIFAILSILFFYSNLTFSYLQMGDVILWDIKNIKDAIFSGNLYFWNNAYFTIATSSTVPIHPKSLLIALLPNNIYPQVSIMFHITIMGYGLFLFLREKKLSIKASIFGAVALMFSNAMITLILPGHLGKFETYCYFPFVLYFLSKAMNSEKWIHFLLTGAFLGIAFLGGALDVAMYFALFLSCYFLYLLYNKKNDKKIIDFIKTDIKKIILLCVKFALVAVFSFLMSIQIIMITRNTQDMGAAGVTDKNQLWEWATRWSYPPEEVLGFFMPGFFGYYSGSQTHPYWGRIANMPGEPKTSNFSLTSANIGYITFIFIIFAIFISRKKYNEKYFWIGTALFFLIASFGRYFPVIYGALFQIPIFRDARNPNKFIEIIPIPFAILSSFACDYIFKALEAKKEDKLLKYLEDDYKYINIAQKIMYVITIASAVLALITILTNGMIYNSFVTDWKEANAALISKNIFMSFIRLTLISSSVLLLINNAISLKEVTIKDKFLVIVPLIGFILFSVYDLGHIGFLIIGSIIVFLYVVIANKDKLFYKYLPYMFIAVLFLDLAQSGNMFVVKSNYDQMYKSTPIVDHILNEKGNETTMPILIPYLYRYTTHTMPYYKIPLTEPPAASRLSKDITDVFSAFRINDYVGYQPRLMDLLGVRYILSPTYLDQSILSNDLTKITEYQDQFSAAVLYELKGYRNKYEFVNNAYNAVDFNDGLGRITMPNFNLANEVVLLNNSNNNITLNNGNAIYTAELLEESNNKIVINVKTPEAGVLVSKERYNTDWSVTVNGEKKELLNANLLFMGVYVDAGDNNIVFEFTPTMKYLYSTIICWIIFILISVLNIVLYFKKQDN
ncbi:YfhO family protein [Brachyspira intermedia]|uniref:YfhO family protein n=1 Tax=Brachyspira intermedia TaxID=84377 RepID=UPI0030073B20